MLQNSSWAETEPTSLAQAATQTSIARLTRCTLLGRSTAWSAGAQVSIEQHALEPRAAGGGLLRRASHSRWGSPSVCVRNDRAAPACAGEAFRASLIAHIIGSTLAANTVPQHCCQHLASVHSSATCAVHAFAGSCRQRILTVQSSEGKSAVSRLQSGDHSGRMACHLSGALTHRGVWFPA